MQDRLGDLRRQRELVAEHLRWLDREIARESAVSGQPNTPTAAPIAPLSPTIPISKSESVSPAVAAVPSPGSTIATTAPFAAVVPGHDLPAIDPNAVKSRTSWGCFFYILIAAVVLAGGTWALVWLARSTWSKELPPYFAPVTVIALVLVLGAAIRSLIARFRRD